jgi:hypothetical protein
VDVDGEAILVLLQLRKYLLILIHKLDKPLYSLIFAKMVCARE